MMKAMRALTRYAAAGIEDTGLGESDFRVLEVLLHKGPLPINTICPIADLTPGSISIAVDRLVSRGWSAASGAPKTGAFGSLPQPTGKGPYCSSLPKANPGAHATKTVTNSTLGSLLGTWWCFDWTGGSNTAKS
jgi:hypothetical protein